MYIFEHVAVTKVSIIIEQYNQIYDLNAVNTTGKFVLDADFNTKEEFLCVDSHLAKNMMTHQAHGVKFMFDSCLESIARHNVDSGSGCILAHCMGTGTLVYLVGSSNGNQKITLGISLGDQENILSFFITGCQEICQETANIKMEPILLLFFL